jgi:hypothetical protein
VDLKYTAEQQAFRREVRAFLEAELPISICSISPRLPKPTPLRGRYTPSITTPTEDSNPGLSPTVPMPRMREVVEFSSVVEATVSPGVNAVISLMSLTPESLSCWADSAMTEIGTSWMFCTRFCAVTMISVRPGWFAASWARLG